MRSTTWVGWVLVMGFGEVACGGTTTGGGTAGVSSGTAGSSGSGGSVNLTCASMPQSCPVAPASQGSASIHFQGPSVQAAAAGQMCPAGVHFADAPTTLAADQRTTGSTRPKDTVVDGEQAREFACSVVPSGDKFAVSGSMKVPAFDKDNKPLSLPTQIQLATTIGKDESGATGSLTVADDQTAGLFYRATACTFSVKADAQNTRLGIDAGKAWGSVICPSLIDPGDPSSSCTVDVGYFILENCAQQ